MTSKATIEKVCLLLQQASDLLTENPQENRPAIFQQEFHSDLDWFQRLEMAASQEEYLDRYAKILSNDLRSLATSRTMQIYHQIWKVERQQQGLTLGQMIDQLETMDPTLNLVVLKDGKEYLPDNTCSYRGYYEDLALELILSEPPITVAPVLAMLKKAVGNVFYGYKGGDYIMDRDSVVWGTHDSSQSEGFRLTGIQLNNGRVEITGKKVGV